MCINVCVCVFVLYWFFVVIFFLPLWQLRRSNLLSRGVDVANHKVLGDLLHVLVVEESVEAQLIWKRAREERGGEDISRGSVG